MNYVITFMVCGTMEHSKTIQTMKEYLSDFLEKDLHLTSQPPGGQTNNKLFLKKLIFCHQAKLHLMFYYRISRQDNNHKAQLIV